MNLMKMGLHKVHERKKSRGVYCYLLQISLGKGQESMIRTSISCEKAS